MDARNLSPNRQTYGHVRTRVRARPRQRMRWLALENKDWVPIRIRFILGCIRESMGRVQIDSFTTEAYDPFC